VVYVHYSYDCMQIGFVGDTDLSVLHLGLFTDADVAGDRGSMKSTYGVFLALMGPRTFYLLCAVSKKTNCISHNTVEADLVALNLGLRTGGIPALDLWKVILHKKISLKVYEDNQATSRIVTTGKYAALRHVHRVHGVGLRWLHELHHSKMYFCCLTLSPLLKPLTSRQNISSQQTNGSMHYFVVVYSSSRCIVLNLVWWHPS
jgi:hypothetical protein